MAKWKAWLLIAVMVFLTGLLLWCGMKFELRCDRVAVDRVDAAVKRRFLGLLTLSTESIPDVIKASRVGEDKLTGGAVSKHRRSVTEKLVLTSRDGTKWNSTLRTPSFGTRTNIMAQQVNEFIKDPSGSSLTTWWMPWLVNVCAIPFVLLSVFMVGEPLLRALGFFKPTPHPDQENS